MSENNEIEDDMVVDDHGTEVAETAEVAEVASLCPSAEIFSMVLSFILNSFLNS